MKDLVLHPYSGGGVILPAIGFQILEILDEVKLVRLAYGPVQEIQETVCVRSRIDAGEQRAAQQSRQFRKVRSGAEWADGLGCPDVIAERDAWIRINSPISSIPWQPQVGAEFESVFAFAPAQRVRITVKHALGPGG